MGKSYCYNDIIEPNKKVMGELKKIKDDNTEMKKMAFIAVALAFLGIALTALFKITKFNLFFYSVVFALYFIGCLWLLYRADKLRDKPFIKWF